MDIGEDEPKKIDEGLYSRQLYVLGHEAQQKIAGARVFIAGLKGLGIEIAKNIILIGVKSVTIWDDGVAELEDLGSQFYLSEKDVNKKKRSEASLSNLAELNEYVNVSIHLSQNLEKEFFKNFDVAIFTNESILYEDINKYNQWCNEFNTKFIWAQTRGVFGFIFNDFGNTFVVKDQTGEDPKEGMISAIEAKEGIIHALEGKKVDLQDGDYVKFKEIEGMENLNDKETWRIEMITQFSFAVTQENPEKKGSYIRVDLSKFGEYKDKGTYTQIKQSKEHSFLRLEESNNNFEKAGTLECCWMIDYEKQKHAAFKALWKFEQNNDGKKPRPHNTEDAMKIIEICKDQNKEDPSLVNEELIKTLSFVASSEISCVCAFIGALVSQEALKAVSQKYTPIKQWYFFDEGKKALPSNFLDMKEENFKITQPTRYAHQIACFGNELTERIRSLRYFLVGCGAIGCEMIKNFAMMGVGTLGNGKVITTDMDNIERSNLNRQFLFRPKDIDRPKSETSAEVAKKLNPELNIEWHTLRAGEIGRAHV